MTEVITKLSYETDVEITGHLCDEAVIIETSKKWRAEIGIDKNPMKLFFFFGPHAYCCHFEIDGEVLETKEQLDKLIGCEIISKDQTQGDKTMNNPREMVHWTMLRFYLKDGKILKMKAIEKYIKGKAMCYEHFGCDYMI